MEYNIINYNQIEKIFRFKENEHKTNLRLIHHTGTKFKLLPYTTQNNKVESFWGITGAFSREITAKKTGTFDKQSIFNKVLSIVSNSSKNRGLLLSVIGEIFFDEKDELIIAHPQFFNYISSDKKQSEIGRFLASIFSTQEIRNNFLNVYKNPPKNVLLKLLHDSLPKLEEESSEKNKYVNYLWDIRFRFENDLILLLKDEKLFIEHFQQLLQYYYFHYITQLVLHLDNFFDETLDIFPLFYSFDWEKRMQSRRSYTEGWKVVEPKLHKLYAHVNCLEIMNCIKHKDEFMSYKQFKNYVLTLDKNSRELLNNELNEIINEYKARVLDVPWDKFKEPSDMNKYNEPCLNSIRNLFYHIDFQFKNSVTRKKMYTNYYNGFYEFSKTSFLKKSGSLGYTLNLKQEYIIFLTKICIGNQDKLALNELFNEFEYRGIYFDRDSRKELVELYEKLNLIEKKSDSGDAQYVKYIS
ncbi:DNA phosphorothioation-dependent restriction protein DptG [Bacillus carboniphilus]|uniref:DNA phosphorothioation-dependent restriction protein DptG n=1 Tax=Bacillus carboniphilus TaxID=86663 RepID=A0ABY9JW22_9BACI|nr:DNA phosphorothioation-dependent restriction protein DptG [Bacillus carboniphilus]WLR42615.1 DNA phosphorothioation-dependent restriction protein DptG [Bacillus carboniphilus]